MHRWVLIPAGLLVVIGIATWVYARIRLRPPTEVDEVYHDFQEQDPAYRRYLLWCQWGLGLTAAGVLLLMLATLF